MSKLKKIPKSTALITYYLIHSVLKATFYDLPKNIKTGIIYSIRPEEKMKIKRELETKKRIDLIEEAIATLKRLTYAIHHDPEYLKSKEGQSDLKELKK